MGSAQLLKASSQFLKMNGSTSIGGLGDYTVMGWVKRLTTPGSNYECLWSINNRARLDVRNGATGDFVYTVSTASQNGPGTQSVPSLQWVHLALRRSGGNLRYFINGVKGPDEFGSDATAVPDDVLTIGSVTTAGLSLLDGLVTDVALWSAALSDAEVAKPYTQRKTLAALIAGGAFAAGNAAERFSLDGSGGAITGGQAGLANLGSRGDAALIVGGGAPSWSGDSPFPSNQDGMLMRAAGLGVL